MKISPMTIKSAKIVSEWKYEEPYSLYNHESSEEGIKELLNGDFYIVRNETEGIIGYFCFGKSAQVPAGTLKGVYTDNALDIGLAMRPDLTGIRKGYEFIINGVEFSTKAFQPKTLRLSVASFNKRAMKVYKRVGFEPKSSFVASNNIEFIIMLLQIRSEVSFL